MASRTPCGRPMVASIAFGADLADFDIFTVPRRWHEPDESHEQPE